MLILNFLNSVGYLNFKLLRYKLILILTLDFLYHL
jgi:hypothetical protein